MYAWKDIEVEIEDACEHIKGLQQVYAKRQTAGLWKMIRRLRKLFANSNADVSKSLKGVWHFYRYDDKYKNHDCFIGFKTATDLEHIIMMKSLTIGMLV